MNIEWLNLLSASQNLFDGSIKQQTSSMIFMNILIWIFILLCIIYKIKQYKHTSYYAITRNSYLKVILNKGLLGEYAIYKKLQKLEKQGTKFLFNVYIPKENEETTEIDMLMICKNGIYVIESKNYSGWIFGNETQKYWTQTLPRGKGRSLKTQFLNPIIQNKGHIKYLKNMVGSDIDIKSIIVFSERCTFKDLTLKNNDIKVVNRYEIMQTVEKMLISIPNVKLEKEMINTIYDKLYPYTQISDIEKEQHIKNIYKKRETECVTEDNGIIDYSKKENTVVKFEETDSAHHSKLVSDEVCPKCGGKLVKRIAKTGRYAGSSFWGCSNYPKCKFIKNENQKNYS